MMQQQRVCRQASAVAGQRVASLPCVQPLPTGARRRCCSLVSPRLVELAQQQGMGWSPPAGRPRAIQCASSRPEQQQHPTAAPDADGPQQQPGAEQQQQQPPQQRRERDLVIPMAVAISLAGYALIALIGLLDSY